MDTAGPWTVKLFENVMPLAITRHARRVIIKTTKDGIDTVLL